MCWSTEPTILYLKNDHKKISTMVTSTGQMEDVGLITSVVFI